jgi:hypothetical protein
MGSLFNIRDVGGYIGDHIERGRYMFRVGSYGLSLLAASVSFFQVVQAKLLIPMWWLAVLLVIAASGWGMLIWLEFFGKPPRKPPKHDASTVEAGQ